MSNSPGNVLRVSVADLNATSRPSSTLLTSAVGRSVVEWLPDRIGDYDPYNFFSHLAGPILLRCTSEFELASSRLALGVRPFFVTGVV